VLLQQIGRDLVAQLLLDVDAALEKGATLLGENRLHGALRASMGKGGESGQKGG